MVTPPIIIGIPGDVGIFASAEAVTRNLDAETLRGPYGAYDSEGRLLELVPTRVKKRRLFWTHAVDALQIRITEGYPAHQADLNRLLREHLNSIGDPPLVEATTHDLIARVAEQDGYVE